MTPRSDPNKTAPAAVLHGSMFSKSCALAHKRVPCTRAAAQAAALRLLYHDAAKRPQQNRTCCGFAWFNVLKALCASTGACALHMRSRASGGLEDYYTIFLSSHFAYRSCSLRNMVSMPLNSCFACGSHALTGYIIPQLGRKGPPAFK